LKSCVSALKRARPACEICGLPIEGQAYKLRLEGAELVVCSKCRARVSTAQALPLAAPARPPQALAKPKPRRPASSSGTSREEYDVVENYGAVVKAARERLGLSIAELAARIKEKESVLRRIESGKLRPTLELAKKLEKALRVKLVEKVRVEEEARGATSEKPELTLGDVADVVLKKGGGG